MIIAILSGNELNEDDVAVFQSSIYDQSRHYCYSGDEEEHLDLDLDDDDDDDDDDDNDDDDDDDDDHDDDGDDDDDEEDTNDQEKAVFSKESCKNQDKSEAVLTG